MSRPNYEYKTVNISLEPPTDRIVKPTIETAANRWAEMGWETVSVMAISSEDKQRGYADSILIKRPM